MLRNFQVVFYTIAISLLALIGISYLPVEHELVPPNVATNELLAKVDTLEEALIWVNDYNLWLIEISENGVARFDTKDEEVYRFLLRMYPDVFTFNGKYYPEAPPWRPPTTNKDTYLDNQYALTMMEVHDAWSITTGDSSVVVAVIDTGIDATNQEFQGIVSTRSYNSYTKLVGISEVVDTQGHGTAVSGIIAAKKDNSYGIAGIAQNIELMVIKASRNDSSSFYDSDVIEGIYYATNQGAHIINMSLGGGAKNTLMENAVNHAANAGVVLVAASGNDGNDALRYPAAYENVLSVSSVDATRNIAEYSNFGSTIAISAPGSDIYTIGLDNTFIISSGTSLAAPQVSGVLALIKSSNLTLIREDLIQRLFDGAMDEGSVGWDPYFGIGIVNALRSITIEYYQVTFLDAYDEVLDIQWVPNGESAIAPDAPEKDPDDGYVYEFIGWDQPFHMVEQNMTIRPVYQTIVRTYLIRFLSEDASVVYQEEYLAYDERIMPPVAPTKESTQEVDYVFVGWHPVLTEQATVTKDQDFVAVFEEIPRTYSILFYDADGVSILQETTQVVGSTITPPMSPVKEPTQASIFIFDGWLGYVDGMVVTTDHVFTASYREEPRMYTILFLVEEGIVWVEEILTYGSQIFAPDNPIKDSTNTTRYEFISWDSAFVEGMEVTGDRIFVAIFEELDINYTILFMDEDQTTLLKEIVAIYGTIILAPDNPTKEMTSEERFIFNGYSPKFVEGTLVTQNMVYIATYLSTPREYTYTFFDEDETTILVQHTVLYGSLMEIPTPIKESTDELKFTFVGWSNPIPEDGIVISDSEHAAIFEASPRTYLVRVIIDEEIMVYEVVYGGSILLPAIPDHLETFFLEWSHSGEDITEELDIVALFRERELYTILFMDQDIELFRIEVYEGNTLTSVPVVPTKVGYTSSWSITDFDNIQEHKIVEVLYTPILYRIRFLAEDGSVLLETEVAYNQTIESIDAPEVVGMKFSGWYLGNRKFDFDTLVTKDMDLVAKYYKPIGCSLSLANWSIIAAFAIGLGFVRRRKAI